MEREFWLERWTRQEIGFHQQEINPWLIRHWETLALPAGSAVFVPLCGKSLDMRWLESRGHSVIGVELAETAVRGFYEAGKEACLSERQRRLVRHRNPAGTITLYCGDVMELTGLELRGVTGVFDRAALIALPPLQRAHYADHVLRVIPDGAQILLVTLEYPQDRIDGPPHSVPEAEVRALYGGRCRIERLGDERACAVPPRFAEAGVDSAVEVAYRLIKER